MVLFGTARFFTAPDPDTIADVVKDKIGLFTTVYENLRDFRTSNN